MSAGLVVAVVVAVAVSLRRDPPATFPPTPTAPREVGDARVGPVRVTVDATRNDRWVYFDFSRGAVIERPDPLGWDLAFRRFGMAVNGGAGFAGQGGVVDLGEVPFDSVREPPTDGYSTSDARRDSANPALEDWYDYGFTSHLLVPRPRVYAIRTADGRSAFVRFLSYYCPGPTPGCVTFEYVYLGDRRGR